MSRTIAIMLLFSLIVPSIFMALGDTEPNDSFDQAEQIGEGTFSGTVSSGLITDDDYYKVSVPAEKSVLVTVISGSSADISLTLYDGNRAEQSSAYSENGAMDYVFYDGKSTTTYTVYLYFSGDGDYNFTVEFRPSDMQSAATSIGNGDTLNKDIKVGEEVHWYKIALGDGQGVNITGTASGDGVYVDISNSNGDELDTNYLNNQHQSFSLAYATETQATVYLTVYPVGYGYIDITYTLAVEIDSVPSAPRNLQATAGNGTVTLSWDAPSSNGGAPILYYNISRDNGGGWWTIDCTTDTTYVDNYVGNGLNNYTVTAVNWVGESDPSNKVSLAPLTIPSAPYLGNGSDYITAGDGYIEINWTEPDNGGSPITEYKIYRGTTSGEETILTTVNAPKTTYKDSSVENGQTYYYYVTALNGIGEGDRSMEVSATPKGPPVAPGTLQVSVGKDSVTLTWTPSTDNGGSPITGYKIYRGTSLDNMEYITTVSASTTTYKDTAVKPGETYYYKVSGLNSEGESSTGAAVSGSVPKAEENSVGIGLALAILVIAVIVALAAFFLKKRKKPEESEPPEEKNRG